MSKISLDDALFTDGTTLRAYRKGLVDRFTGQGLPTEKVIASAQSIETYIVGASDDLTKDDRRQSVERQLGQNSDATKAIENAKKIEAYVTGKAA